VALSVGYSAPAEPVVFLERTNRYLARVRPIGRGRRFDAHVPNPGRMVELLRPGVTQGWVVRADAPGRATDFDLVAVRHRGTVVSIDSRIANRLVARTLERRRVPARTGWRAEVTVGAHRLDFGRFGADGALRELLEIKSSNWRIGDTAMFPDAPSSRGAAHLQSLAQAARRGIAARVWFVVQRSDVRSFSIHRLRDPELAAAFDAARAAGVRVDARALRVRCDGVRWGPRLPVLVRGPLGTYKGGADPSPVG
jgi:sugar fermentation stimulation protein A